MLVCVQRTVAMINSNVKGLQERNAQLDASLSEHVQALQQERVQVSLTFAAAGRERSAAVSHRRDYQRPAAHRHAQNEQAVFVGQLPFWIRLCCQIFF